MIDTDFENLSTVYIRSLKSLGFAPSIGSFTYPVEFIIDNNDIDFKLFAEKYCLDLSNDLDLHLTRLYFLHPKVQVLFHKIGFENKDYLLEKVNKFLGIKPLVRKT